MNFLNDEHVPIRDIQVDERKRKLDHQRVAALAESIRNVGLFHPITITESNHLVGGLHRLEACKSLDWENIPARVLPDAGDALRELLEIDENLIRAELTVLEHAEHLMRRKELYEQFYPEASAGAARARGMNLAIGNNVGEIISPTFAKDTAEQTGISERTVQQEVQIATLISKDLRDKLRNTRVADRKVDLLKLARLGKSDPERQRDVVEQLARGEIKIVRRSPRQQGGKEQSQPRADSSPECQPKSCLGKHSAIYADPSWRSGARDHNGAGLGVEAVCSIPVDEVASPDSVLFLWVPARSLPDGFKVLDAWRFNYWTCAVFANGVDGGFAFDDDHEILLIAGRGKPSPLQWELPFLMSGPRIHNAKGILTCLEKAYPDIVNVLRPPDQAPEKTPVEDDTLSPRNGRDSFNYSDVIQGSLAIGDPSREQAPQGEDSGSVPAGERVGVAGAPNNHAAEAIHQQIKEECLGKGGPKPRVHQKGKVAVVAVQSEAEPADYADLSPVQSLERGDNGGGPTENKAYSVGSVGEVAGLAREGGREGEQPVAGGDENIEKDVPAPNHASETVNQDCDRHTKSDSTSTTKAAGAPVDSPAAVVLIETREDGARLYKTGEDKINGELGRIEYADGHMGPEIALAMLRKCWRFVEDHT